MFRLKPIRRKKDAPRLRGAADFAFVLLLVLALFFGARPALSALAALVLPAGGTRGLAIDTDGAASGQAPQLLFPVAGHPFPAWLKRRAGSADIPKIAIDIDDLGEDGPSTRRAIALPPQVALAFLPYAKDTPLLARAAERSGHEVIAHVPMEAIGPADPGPMALDVGLSPDEIRTRLSWSLARVPGAVGINNHEGSRFTADAKLLEPVVAVLKERHLFFFDSRTMGDSKVVPVARGAGVLSAERDVFLDDTPDEAEVTKELAELEKRARANGVAIAIGHPHAATLDVLERWIGQEKGFRLIPLSEALQIKSEMEIAGR